MSKTCILCGRWIPNETFVYEDKICIREVCSACASEEMKRTPARRMRIPAEGMDGAIQLSGAILQKCFKHYGNLYLAALTEVNMTGSFEGVEWQKFLEYHKALFRYSDLALGKMPELMAYTRRKKAEAANSVAKAVVGEIEAMLAT